MEASAGLYDRSTNDWVRGMVGQEDYQFVNVASLFSTAYTDHVPSFAGNVITLIHNALSACAQTEWLLGWWREKFWEHAEDVKGLIRFNVLMKIAFEANFKTALCSWKVQRMHQIVELLRIIEFACMDRRTIYCSYPYFISNRISNSTH